MARSAASRRGKKAIKGSRLPGTGYPLGEVRRIAKLPGNRGDSGLAAHGLSCLGDEVLRRLPVLAVRAHHLDEALPDPNGACVILLHLLQQVRLVPQGMDVARGDGERLL